MNQKEKGAKLILFALCLCALTATASPCRVLSRLFEKQRPSAKLSQAESDLREKTMAEAFGAAHSDPLDADPNAVIKRAWALDELNRILKAENRSLVTFTDAERKELAESIVKGVEARSARESVEKEAKARVASVAAAMGELGRPGLKRLKLPSRKVQELLLQILREEITEKKITFHPLPFTERDQLARTARAELESRLDAVDTLLQSEKATSAREWPLSTQGVRQALLAVLNQRLTAERASLRTLPDSTRQNEVRNAFQEFSARLAAINAALDEEISQTGKPWNWQVMWQRKRFNRMLMENLNKELAKGNRSFLELTRKQRRDEAKALVDAALAPIQRRPNLKVMGIGVGVPSLLGWASMIVPKAVQPAWYVLTGIFAGPFTFGVNYYMGGLLKPLFSLSGAASPKGRATLVQREIDHITSARSDADAEGPSEFEKEMADIGAASTGKSDPFKDGRFANNESELRPADAFNDAMEEADPNKGEMIIANALLYHTDQFPEVQKLSRPGARLFFFKLAKRYGNAEALEKIRGYIKHFASEDGTDPQPALQQLDEIFAFASTPAPTKAANDSH